MCVRKIQENSVVLFSGKLVMQHILKRTEDFSRFRNNYLIFLKLIEINQINSTHTTTQNL